MLSIYAFRGRTCASICPRPCRSFVWSCPSGTYFVVQLLGFIATLEQILKPDHWVLHHGALTCVICARIMRIHESSTTMLKQSWPKTCELMFWRLSVLLVWQNVGLEKYNNNAIDTIAEILKWNMLLSFISHFDKLALRICPYCSVLLWKRGVPGMFCV